jgi:Sec-independent protein translocase protein TatA
VFGVSMWEVLLILVVALIFLGPKQLAETAKVMGRLYKELQKMTWDIRNSIDIDSLTSSRPEPPKSKPPQAPPANLFPKPEEKSGPDFYADLLNQSEETDKGRQQKEEEKKPESPEKKPDAPEKKS